MGDLPVAWLGSSREELGSLQVDLAAAEFVLARARWPDPEARSEARTLAERAAGRYRAAPSESNDELAEVERWLAAHR